ncbi:MAG: hypothetical protein IPK58_24580 [Acidobacteria bacterium]|nr:hypothetical protein [Acidobacteriota bacterium]
MKFVVVTNGMTLARSGTDFVDGVIRELIWTGGEYVDSERNMVYAGLPVVWLLVQTQNETIPSIEFRMEEVNDVGLNHKHEFEIDARFGDGTVTLVLSPLGESRIQGTRLYYRIPHPASLENPIQTFAG